MYFKFLTQLKFKGIQTICMQNKNQFKYKMNEDVLFMFRKYKRNNHKNTFFVLY